MNEGEEHKAALNEDNPPSDEDAGEEGLGTESGAEGGPGDGDQDVTDLMPERRGEVKYPDMEDPDELRSDAVPVEGGVEEDPDTVTDASHGAKE